MAKNTRGWHGLDATSDAMRLSYDEGLVICGRNRCGRRGLAGGKDSTRHRTLRQVMMKDSSFAEGIDAAEEDSRVGRTRRDIGRGAVKS